MCYCCIKEVKQIGIIKAKKSWSGAAGNRNHVSGSPV